MRFQIMHESPGRMRLRADLRSMSLGQADILEAWILSLPGVERAAVHESTLASSSFIAETGKSFAGGFRAFLLKAPERRSIRRSGAAGK